MILLQTHKFSIRLNLTSETEGTAILSCFQGHNLSSKKKPLHLHYAFFQ